jgi:hypothetical protein
MHRPTVSAEPVLRPDSFTDKNGVTIYGSVHRDGGMYRMWYQAMPADWDWKRDMATVAYAESDDGINWRKPKLGLIKERPEAGNMLNLGLHCPSVFIDPDSPPSHRYRATGCGYKHLFMHHPSITEQGYYTAHSRDGLHWELDSSKPTWPWMDVITSAYHPGRRAATVAMKRTIPLSRIARRAIWTADFRKGEYGQAVSALLPDEFDDVAAVARGCVSGDYYGMGLMPAGQGMLGFLWPFWHELPYAPNVGLYGFSDVTLVYQQDPGGRWIHFPGRRNFIDHGMYPWMSGWLNTASTTVEVGDEQWLYFGGYSMSHGFYVDDKWQAIERWTKYASEHCVGGIGVAKWPKWRLVGLESDPAGSFLIDLGYVKEPTELVLNYATRAGGSVRAQLEGVDDSAGVALTGDSLAKVVPFKSGTVIQPSEKWMSVRLHLECATVYAFELRARA